jgi:hypothetical protein
MISIPSKPISSCRPTNGEMKVAPALAASSAWLAGEAERDVHHRAVGGELLAGLQSVDRQRNLHGDIVRDLRRISASRIISE